MKKHLKILAIGIVLGGTIEKIGNAADVRATGKNISSQQLSVTFAPNDYKLTYGSSARVCVQVVPDSALARNRIELSVDHPEVAQKIVRIADPGCAGAAFDIDSSLDSTCNGLDALRLFAHVNPLPDIRKQQTVRYIRPIITESDFLQNEYCRDLTNGVPNYPFPPPAFGLVTNWRVTIKGNEDGAIFTGLPLSERISANIPTGSGLPSCTPFREAALPGDNVGDRGGGANTAIDSLGMCQRNVNYFRCESQRYQTVVVGKCALPKKKLSFRADSVSAVSTAREDRKPGGLANPAPSISLYEQDLHKNDNP